MVSSPRKIVVLGSTGTIGRNTLGIVAQFPGRFDVVGLAAGKNGDLLREQIRAVRPRFVSVAEPSLARQLESEFPDIEIGCGESGLLACAELPCDVVVVGIVGFTALAPALAAARCGRLIALANKESLVVAGNLFNEAVESGKSTCIPVDSEHNALYQLLKRCEGSEVAELILTASGGPLWKRPDFPLEDVTPDFATKHPNWVMGPKISVDSATMMNKGLEVIEAHYLFQVPEERISVWVHPKSIVHGALKFTDNTFQAQLSVPDMKASIGYAMAYPDRLEQLVEALDWTRVGSLEFFPPDNRRFRCLGLAREALRSGASHIIALNAANEIAVDRFLCGRATFVQIPQLIEQVLEAHLATPVESLESINAIDQKARSQTCELADRLS